jgi:ribosomal protein L11 methyltransferase
MSSEGRVWHEIHFLVPRDGEELLSTWVVEYSGRGVACFPQGALTDVVAYCAAASEVNMLRTVINARWEEFCAVDGLYAPLQVREDTVSEEDWANSWKAHFHPVRIGRRFVVKPTWETWPPADQPAAARPDDLIIELDPQMAFGTGTHATTQMCLEGLEDHLCPGDRVADLGCGSGLLSIGAALLGSGPVEAWEVDPVATPVAVENCVRNGVAAICTVHEGDALATLEGPFDVVVANVHTEFLLHVVPRLAEVLAPGGRAVLSGTTESGGGAVIAALEAAGLELLAQNHRGEWLALIAKKP